MLLKYLTILLIFTTSISYSQQIKGISLDLEEEIVDSNTSFNLDSLQNFHKEIITNSYVITDGNWFSNDEFTLVEKLAYIRDNRTASFQYFFFNRNGKIEVNTNIKDNDTKFLQDTKLSYGAWFIDKDKLNIVMNGFSIQHGKFEYRISYTYKKDNENLLLTIFDKKVISEDKQYHE